MVSPGVGLRWVLGRSMILCMAAGRVVSLVCGCRREIGCLCGMSCPLVFGLDGLVVPRYRVGICFQDGPNQPGGSGNASTYFSEVSGREDI